MWQRNSLTEQLGLDFPIFSAPMTPHAPPLLAAEVSNAGGLGGLGLTGFSPEDAESRIAQFRERSRRSLNVNFLLWPDWGDLSMKGGRTRERLQPLYDGKNLGPVPIPAVPAGGVSPRHMEVLRRTRPQVVSFHFGLPDPETVLQIKALGAMVFGCATTVAEARLLESGGADVIIAQGTEAGGHRGTFTDVAFDRQVGLFSLLPQVVDAVSVPVVAAGGIADGRAIAAALMLGASAVHIGTAFLNCTEALLSREYRTALRDADDTSTAVSRALTGRPARMIRNRIFNELIDLEGDAYPFPAQHRLIRPLGETGDRELTQLFAGQSAALAREGTAKNLIETLVAETDHCLERFA
jgi:nitronate monooxygenase